MPKPKLANLGSEVRKHRGNRTLRDSAKDIGISPATLLRVEAGRVPDVETFGKICNWLGVEASAYLGYPSGSRTLTAAEPSPEVLTVSAHLRADATLNLPTAEALATMIMLAVSRQKPTETDGDA
jgi:transcriptional regulator with XRE-family HTH domain